MADCDLNNIVGVWRNFRTEIPAPFDPSLECLRIGSDGLLFWDYPTGPKTAMSRFRYKLTNLGIQLFTLNGEVHCELEMQLVNGLLKLKGTHGYTSFYVKIFPIALSIEEMGACVKSDKTT